MSNIKVRGAKLPDYRGPYYFLDTERLQREAYGGPDKGLPGDTLEYLAKKIPGFLNKEQPVTSDEYQWFWSITFEVETDQKKLGKVAILFPRARDDARQDGTYADRQIAVYIQDTAPHTIDITAAEDIARRVHFLIRQEFKSPGRGRPIIT